jgi:hypothetical protein
VASGAGKRLGSAELTVGSPVELVAWSGSLDRERLWAVEDCRQLTGALERRLLAAGGVVRARTAEADGARAARRACARQVRPIDALDRPLWLDRVTHRLRCAEQTVQIRIARELVGRCRTLTRSILALDRELQSRTEQPAPRLLTLPGCRPLSAAKLLAETGPGHGT